MVACRTYFDHYDSLQGNFFVPPSATTQLGNTEWNEDGDPNYQNEAMIQGWMVCYYALCEEVDHYVGELLNKLDEHGIADNTLVVFTADHGEALGYHGRRSKSTFFEESAHVPLLIRFPGRIDPGITVTETVASLDIFATALDYLGGNAYEVSDGRSLRRYIEKANYNENFDDEAIVTEWDFRTPTETTNEPPVVYLERSLGGETNLHCKKGSWKLFMTKLATSTRVDELYNLANDPYEMTNLVGNVGGSASDEIVGKAEHLKCLMMEWMERMDGGTNQYFSSAIWNEGIGGGDIAEIKARQTWRAVDIWVSDTAVEVGVPVDVAGQFTRNEYIYLGCTKNGPLNISSITLQGTDTNYLSLSEFTSGSIAEGEYERVKVTYLPDAYGRQITDAQIVIDHDAGGGDRIIDLSAVVPPNSMPVVTSTPTLILEENAAYSYTLTATDIDGDSLTYSGDTVPAWLNFNTNTAVLSGTPARSDIGSHLGYRVSFGFSAYRRWNRCSRR